MPVRIRLVTPISMGRQLQVILHATGRPLAMRERPGEGPGRVRIPHWRSPSCGTFCPSIFAGPHGSPCARRRTASTKCARMLRRFVDSPVVQLRENARTQSGKCGFDSHRARRFRRAVEFGLSGKVPLCGMSGFNPRAIGQPMDSHLVSCPSYLPCASTLIGPKVVGYLTQW